jgi:hypothetical protein
MHVFREVQHDACLRGLCQCWSHSTHRRRPVQRLPDMVCAHIIEVLVLHTLCYLMTIIINCNSTRSNKHFFVVDTMQHCWSDRGVLLLSKRTGASCLIARLMIVYAVLIHPCILSFAFLHVSRIQCSPFCSMPRPLRTLVSISTSSPTLTVCAEHVCIRLLSLFFFCCRNGCFFTDSLSSSSMN